MHSLLLSQQNRLFASTINNLSSGVVITDPNQDDNPIIFTNPSFTAITGYAAPEAHGRNCRFLQGVDTDPAIVREMREAIGSHETFRGLVQNYRKDGSTFFNGLVVTPVFDDDNQLTNFVGVINDVTASREQLRALAARLVQVREEERTQISREIHDVLGQTLTGLKMDISWLGRRTTTLPDTEMAGVLDDKLRSMSGIVDSTIGTVRKIATQLRPSLLDDLGLEAAAEWQVQEFQKRSGIACRFHSNFGETESGPEMDADSATALFRILQETLTNVARHAQASSVEVALQVEDGQVLLKVQDNGRGISTRELSNTRSLGLLGVRERVLSVDGEVEIKGKLGRGTTVSVRVPLQKKVRAAAPVENRP